jgi:hypothetical protein
MDKQKKILLIVIGAVVLAVGGYVLYDKVIKKKIGVNKESKKNILTFTR